MTKPYIGNLGEDGMFGIVVAHPSSVTYSNQSGGTGCLHPEVEGVYLPLHTMNQDHWDKLFKIVGERRDGITANQANRIDTLLREGEWMCRQWRVDRSRLAECHEAWVRVCLDGEEDKYSFSGFPKPVTGVLVWENSD